MTESLTYTANGQAATMTDGNGNVSIAVYDGHDRPSRLRYPNTTGGGTSTTDYTEVGYDAASNVVSQRARAAQTTTVAYDNLNRPTTIDAPSGTMDVAFTYDNLGRTLTSSGNSQTLTNVWDPLSRLTSETGPLGAMSYQYDAAGRRTRITWPDTVYAQYDHDVLGAATAIRLNGAGSGADVLATYAYDTQSRLSGITRGNGTTTAYGYDAWGRMNALSHDVAGGGSYDVAYAFTWNPGGQIASRTVSNAVYVASASADASYANDGLNRMTTVNGGGLSYDSNQNVTGALGSTYGYDAANRLTSATIGGTGYSFGYDPAGRLYDTPTSGLRLQYVGDQLVGEYNSGGALLTRHVPAGLDAPVATLFSGGLRYQQLADERGSVVALTDGSAVAAGINTYDEYGVATASDRFQYTGQAFLAPGLYNYRARVYAPQLGRFLQTDPIGYAAGANLYGYVSADPVNLSDPMGTQEVCWTEIVRTTETTDERGNQIFDHTYRRQCYDLGDVYKWMDFSLDSLTNKIGDGFCRVFNTLPTGVGTYGSLGFASVAGWGFTDALTVRTVTTGDGGLALSVTEDASEAFGFAQFVGVSAGIIYRGGSSNFTGSSPDSGDAMQDKFDMRPSLGIEFTPNSAGLNMATGIPAAAYYSNNPAQKVILEESFDVC